MDVPRSSRPRRRGSRRRAACRRCCARRSIEDWRREYTEDRPEEGLGGV